MTRRDYARPCAEPASHRTAEEFFTRGVTREMVMRQLPLEGAPLAIAGRARLIAAAPCDRLRHNKLCQFTMTVSRLGAFALSGPTGRFSLTMNR